MIKLFLELNFTSINIELEHVIMNQSMNRTDSTVQIKHPMTESSTKCFLTIPLHKIENIIISTTTVVIITGGILDLELQYINILQYKDAL